MRSTEGAKRKLERDRERTNNRLHAKGALRFMDQDFATVEDLRRAYPAFAGDDAIRAMRAGCTTPMEVEKFCWRRKNEGYVKARAAAQRSQYSARHALGALKSKGKRRKAA